MKQSNRYQQPLQELTRGLRLLCEHLLPNNPLGHSIELSIGSRGNRKDNSWYRVSKKETTEELLEIVFAKDSLEDEVNVYSLVEGLLHQVAHLLNLQEDIRDTSPDGYHTTKFRDRAETLGLTVEKHKYLGYSITSLSKGMKDTVDNLSLNIIPVSKEEGKLMVEAPDTIVIAEELKSILVEFCEITGLSILEVSDSALRQYMKNYRP